jgi:CheY-like chemotaxis protein
VLRPLGVLVAGKATSPADAISLLERLQPELLVTDLLFGNADEGGIAYLKQVLAVCPDVKVIVLATFDESQIVADAIAAGAPSLRAQTRAPRGLGRCRSPGLHHSIFFAPTSGVAALMPTDADTTRPRPPPAPTAATGYPASPR